MSINSYAETYNRLQSNIDDIAIHVPLRAAKLYPTSSGEPIHAMKLIQPDFVVFILQAGENCIFAALL